jgi:hypothetical protein
MKKQIMGASVGLMLFIVPAYGQNQQSTPLPTSTVAELIRMYPGLEGALKRDVTPVQWRIYTCNSGEYKCFNRYGPDWICCAHAERCEQRSDGSASCVPNHK